MKTFISALGYSYQVESDDDIVVLPPHKFHKSERNFAEKMYRKTILDTWVHASETTLALDATGCQGYVCADEIDEPNSGVVDTCDGATLKKWCILARNAENGLSYVHREFASSRVFTCFQSGNVTLSKAMAIAHIFDNSTSGWSKQVKINKCYVDGKNYFRCGECRNYFSIDALSPVKNAVGAHLCCYCAKKSKNRNAIRPYDYKQYLEPIKQAGGSTLFGVEAEVELAVKPVSKLGLTRFDIAAFVIEALGKDFCYVVEDGSLTTNGKYNGDLKYASHGDGTLYAGFEIVSAPADLATHASRWVRLDSCKKLHDENGQRLMRAWDTKTAGFHVHVDKRCLTDLQIGKILRWVNHSNNAKFVQKVAGRSSDVYCRYLDKEVGDALRPERVISPDEESEYNRRRRTAVNVANKNTIEWRIFRGTINPRHMLRNLEFVDAQMSFFYPGNCSIRHCDDYRYFIDYVDNQRKRWPLLAAWLALHKYIETREHEKSIIKPSKVDEPEALA